MVKWFSQMSIYSHLLMRQHIFLTVIYAKLYFGINYLGTNLGYFIFPEVNKEVVILKMLSGLSKKD